MSSVPELLEYEAAEIQGLAEVDTRKDSANVIKLCLGSSANRMVVKVKPLDENEMPFGLSVDRAEALEAYVHPYAFKQAAMAVGGELAPPSVEASTES